MLFCPVGNATYKDCLVIFALKFIKIEHKPTEGLVLEYRSILYKKKTSKVSIKWLNLNNLKFKISVCHSYVIQIIQISFVFTMFLVAFTQMCIIPHSLSIRDNK